MTEIDTLNRNQHRAIAALIEHATVRDAAAACGLGEKTIYRYLSEPAFRAELAQVEGQAIDAATRRLLSLVDSAVQTLRDVLNDDKAGYSHKLRAAQTVLDQLLKLRELRNLEERLSALGIGIQSVKAINRRLDVLESVLSRNGDNFYRRVLKPRMESIPEFSALSDLEILRDLDSFLMGGELASYLTGHDVVITEQIARVIIADFRRKYPDADSIDLGELYNLACEKLDARLSESEKSEGRLLGWI